MNNEYNNQCTRLYEVEKTFRKIGRIQIQERAIRRKEISSNTKIDINIINKGIQSLQMTNELCGLLNKINKTRKMLKREEILDGRKLLVS